MAHGKLGGGASADTVRTATVFQEGSAGASSELVETIEADEDRYIRGVYIQTTGNEGEDGFTVTEITDSADPNLQDGLETDNNSAGTLASHTVRTDSTSGWATTSENFVTLDVEDPQGGIEWNEDEELNVFNTNNYTNPTQIRVIVYYERVSDC